MGPGGPAGPKGDPGVFKAIGHAIKSIGCENKSTKWEEKEWQPRDQTGEGDVSYLDRQDVKCPAEKPFMSAFKLEIDRNNGSKTKGYLRYNYKCCGFDTYDIGLQKDSKLTPSPF
jgi:hypothetical protein